MKLKHTVLQIVLNSIVFFFVCVQALEELVECVNLTTKYTHFWLAQKYINSGKLHMPTNSIRLNIYRKFFKLVQSYDLHKQSHLIRMILYHEARMKQSRVAREDPVPASYYKAVSPVKNNHRHMKSKKIGTPG